MDDIKEDNKKKNKKNNESVMDMFKIKSSKRSVLDNKNKEIKNDSESSDESDDNNMFQFQNFKNNKNNNLDDFDNPDDDNNSDNDDDFDGLNDDNNDLFDNVNKKMDWDDDFLDSSKQLEDMTNNIIEIKSQARGRKTTTVIVGLELKKEEEKLFLTKVRKKVAASGSKKKVLVEELEGGSYHKDKSKKGQPKDKDALKVEIFIFTGDFKEEIREILVNDFNIDEDKIIS